MRREGGEKLDLMDIYILNLSITLGMFAVLIFRAWIEHRNYRMMWKELEWRQTYQTMGRLLKAEKDLFSKVEGGDELYQMLCEIFKVNEEKA
jgi:hypothetical protein